MKTKSKDFRVPAGKQVDLKKWPTRVKLIYKSKKHYHKLLENQVTALSVRQRPNDIALEVGFWSDSRRSGARRCRSTPQQLGKLRINLSSSCM